LKKKPAKSKPGEHKENLWVTLARYSEIGFMIPASLVVGYLLGALIDHLLHTHWIYLFGIIFGAVVGFVSMIRRALQSDEDEAEGDGQEGTKDKYDGGGGSDERQ
jgi:F0F1-type ATP synthase assembly protein I